MHIKIALVDKSTTTYNTHQAPAEPRRSWVKKTGTAIGWFAATGWPLTQIAQALGFL